MRIGNAAYIQRQHDVHGEMVLCLETILTDPRVVWEDPSLAPLLEHLVEEAMAASLVEDTGLWEYRTLPRHYTFSKAMCWVAAHRGAAAGRVLRHARASARDWKAWADAERERILERAYNKELGFFTQALDGQYPGRLEPAAAADRAGRSHGSALPVDRARLRDGCSRPMA